MHGSPFGLGLVTPSLGSGLIWFWPGLSLAGPNSSGLSETTAAVSWPMFGITLLCCPVALAWHRLVQAVWLALVPSWMCPTLFLDGHPHGAPFYHYSETFLPFLPLLWILQGGVTSLGYAPVTALTLTVMNAFLYDISIN